MLKPKAKVIFIIFFISVVFVYVRLLSAEPSGINDSIEQETIAPDSLTADIQIEQQESDNLKLNQPHLQQENSAGRRISILRVAEPLPATVVSSGAARLGWKRKDIQRPESVNTLVKEIPLEVKAKKERLKAKMERMKNNTHSSKNPK
ncbi:MAG: hypothetical protein NTX01_05800 [Candidatus Omnitrophica bacterium]|nr:hypothetical protein [Candidatus Omnitrophota bacterium]